MITTEHSETVRSHRTRRASAVASSSNAGSAPLSHGERTLGFARAVACHAQVPRRGGGSRCSGGDRSRGAGGEHLTGVHPGTLRLRLFSAGGAGSRPVGRRVGCVRCHGGVRGPDRGGAGTARVSARTPTVLAARHDRTNPLRPQQRSAPLGRGIANIRTDVATGGVNHGYVLGTVATGASIHPRRDDSARNDRAIPRR